MELSGRVVEEDLDDVARLLRPRHYWPFFALDVWQGAAVFLLVVWITILGLLGHRNPNWTAIAVIWCVIGGIVLWSSRSVRRERRDELARINAAVPECFTLTTAGIRWTKRDGGEVLLDWSDVSGWRERGRVVAIDQPGGTPAVLVSVAHLPEMERQRLRDFLRSQIAPCSPSATGIVR